MEKNNKRKAELGESVEKRVLIAVISENPDESLHDLIKVLEDHNYEVFKYNGADEFISQMKEIRVDIILTEGTLLDPMNPFQRLAQILRGINLPVIMISSNDNIINSRYNWLAHNIVSPILELVGEHFYDRINKSGEVKRLKEGIKQVELPDEEERLKEKVEHAYLPDEENKKKLEREKAGEHHQRMVWRGDRERMFRKIVTELDKNGKATGKKVWERMQDNGFKDISIKQVNSHLQKHRGKVDTSPGQDASRHGMEEHSSKTDAAMNTINGNLNTSQKQHFITELPNNNIPGNFENPNIFYDRENFGNGKGKDIIQDQNDMSDDFSWSWADFIQAIQSSPGPIEAPPFYTMEGQPSNFLVNNIHGQAFDKNVSDLPSKEDEGVYIPAGPNFDDLHFEDIDPQQHSDDMDYDFFELLDSDFMKPDS